MYVDERLTTMRFEMADHCGAVDFVAADAPTDVAAASGKRMLSSKLDNLVRRIPAKEIWGRREHHWRTRAQQVERRPLLTLAMDTRLAVLRQKEGRDMAYVQRSVRV